MSNGPPNFQPMANYFSQQGEDFLLDAFFGFKPNGYFVDVGAFDGVHLSNSYIFEQRGWSGLCVEAAPRYFELCAKNRPRSRCVNAACVAVECGPVEFRFERGGLFSGIDADPHKVALEYAHKGLKFDGFETIRVESRTLDVLLDDDVAEIDFVSIDVEGTEVDVLRGLNFDRYRPRVLLLEANTAHSLQLLDGYLSPKGYRRARSMRWNHFYARNEADFHGLRAVTGSVTLNPVPHPLDSSLDALSYPKGTMHWSPDS